MSSGQLNSGSSAQGTSPVAANGHNDGQVHNSTANTTPSNTPNTAQLPQAVVPLSSLQLPGDTEVRIDLTTFYSNQNTGSEK
jgi:hypothetical protein